jgi:hypothetical protein
MSITRCAGCMVLFLGLAGAGRTQITLEPLVSNVICSNEPFEVSFEAMGVFDPGNTFHAQLSDASGSFAAPILLGSLAGTTSGTITCVSPGVDGTGFRVRVVSDAPAEASAPSAEVLVFADPDAGMSVSLTICGIPPSLDLTDLLDGSPDAGGVWTVVSGTGILVGPTGPYIGLTYGANVLAYTVDIAGCSATSTATITAIEPPQAGINSAITVCSSDPSFNMYLSLDGSPSSGGAWTAPTGSQVSNVFDPATDPPGLYSYIVAGQPPCANAMATLSIAVVQSPDAGLDASLNWCASAGPFIMTDHLNGQPQPGGTWTYAGQPHSPVFIPGTDLPGTYLYTVPGPAPCMNASSQLSITIGACLTTPPQQFGIQYVTE